MYTRTYTEESHTPDDVAAWRGPAVLEFGTNWCPICANAQGDVEAVMTELAGVPHVKVEDGPGRRLGRAFRVKLWPTLIFLLDGAEVARVVRPTSAAEIRRAAEAMAGKLA